MGKFRLFAVIMCLAMSSVWAETIVFRGGDVLAAEVSSQTPRVLNLPAEEQGGSRVYALVTVKLHPGRTVSVEDYSLNALGGLYRCIAIREENGAFNAEKWHFNAVSPRKRYGLLFALQIPVGQNYNNVKFDLVCNAPGKWVRTSIPFTDRGSQGFTPATSIPVSGKFPAVK